MEKQREASQDSERKKGSSCKRTCFVTEKSTSFSTSFPSPCKFHIRMQTLLKPFVFFLLLTKDGKVLQTVMKGCGSSDTCNSPPKHLNMGRGKSIRTSLTCCIGEACANSTPPVPRVESKTNGKQCPSCYSSSGTCITEMVNCTGSERYCFDVFSRSNADSRARDMIMKGCTTKSACESINKGVPLIWEENNAVIIKAKCTPDPSRGTRSSGLLLPTFSGLLLLKILL
ncbi:phospholipase A2 inhibitor gamma subunit B-like isoform X2 [Rhineura floridana]|uniref:phospholipase A2 inhibitor gamma subunit B-like isoform X2 n=1 Tax=Rhineura floridana TaxID=261503 RepID=UPI002AC7EAFE|nr:phospholipase A2 inhibitor gamma subunit B-like isoform X2 [Rhineura floridana]